jgi:tRNA threonylcarbamoyl adenosine modification protein YeaZ
LDTLFENLSVGLLEEGQLRANYFSLCRRRNATIALEVLDELLQNLRWDLEEVGALYVTRGPGSYTGVRIGLSLVKTLAQVRHIPVHAVDSLQVLAMQVAPQPEAFPVYLNCTRQEVFWAWFAHGADGVPARQSPIQLTSFADLPEATTQTRGRLQRLAAKPEALFDELQQLPLAYPLPDAWMIFRAVTATSAPAVALAELQPLYLKKDV